MRTGESSTTATAVLRSIPALPAYRFWPDDLSSADAGMEGVRGHRQVTDAYLVNLAAAHPDARLAALDAALERFAPAVAALVPS